MPGRINDLKLRSSATECLWAAAGLQVRRNEVNAWSRPPASLPMAVQLSDTEQQFAAEFLCGSICKRGGGVSPPVSFVSVLLVHLHPPQARPVFPGSRPHLRLPLPAAAPGVALVPPQHLRLAHPDVPLCRSVLPPSGRGARRRGRFDRGAPPGRRRAKRAPSEDSRDSTKRNQTRAFASRGCAAGIVVLVNLLLSTVNIQQTPPNFNRICV